MWRSGDSRGDILQVARVLAEAAARKPTNASPIRLTSPPLLQLAGAQNLDDPDRTRAPDRSPGQPPSALERFFPWIPPGAYHRRDGVAQAVPRGPSRMPTTNPIPQGAALTAQMDLGDAIYKSLAAKQLVKASDQALEAQRQDTTLNAAQGYFELAKAGVVGARRPKR